MNGYIVLRETDRNIFTVDYAKDVIFPKISEFNSLPDSDEEAYVDALYELDEYRNDEDYNEDSVVEDISTQIETETENSNQSISNQAATESQSVNQVSGGPYQRTRSRFRRLAMTPVEIQNIQQDIEMNSDSDAEFMTAADITMNLEEENDAGEESESNFEIDSEVAFISNNIQNEDDISNSEYHEIWESLFTRYDVIHECYKTYKQDITIP